jgi:hypothetical protein
MNKSPRTRWPATRIQSIGIDEAGVNDDRDMLQELKPELRVVPAPLPQLEVSPHLIWHPRTQNSPLRVWVRGVIKGIAAGV